MSLVSVVRRLRALIMTTGVCVVGSYSQNLQPICGTAALPDPAALQKAWEEMLSKDPGLRDRSGETAKSFVVGMIDTFWVYNLTGQNPPFDRVPAELMATGPTSYIWVTLEEWNNGHVDSAVVNEILLALETRTPPTSRDSTKGILALDRQFFGNPPNINSSFVKDAGDGKSHFLICDVKDGFVPGVNTSYIAGFFFYIDVDANSGFQQFSNRRDMLYIDSYPGIFFPNQGRNAQRPLGTLAHEFEHLIHWRYDPAEISFVDEGLAEYGSHQCGYGFTSPGLYFSDPNVALLSWTQRVEDYARAALWTLYAGEQFGDMFIRNLVQNTGTGIAGFESALSQSGFSATFNSTVTNFHVANILQRRNVNPAYGYVDTLTVQGKPKLFKNIFGTNSTGSRSSLASLAADYLRFFGAETLKTTFTPAGSFAIKAIRVVGNLVTVEDVQPGVPYNSFTDSTSSADIIFVVQNSSQLGSSSYSYSSSGTARTSTVLLVANDDGSTFSSPNTSVRPGDTLFVVFDAVEGGKIDSVLMWFASTGSASLLVRDYNTSYDIVAQPLSGLGGRTRMTAPVNFTVTDTVAMTTMVLLGPQLVRAFPDFVVEVVYGSGQNLFDPLLRRDNGQAVTRSYLSLSQQPTPGRVIYGSLGDFYLRAYLSPTNEPLPPPVFSFHLHQNFPNPFNSMTTIRYDLPQRARVRLVVFDLLGREVAILKDAVEDANSYFLSFDASQLSSGVYFYRITAGTYAAAGKMLLVR